MSMKTGLHMNLNFLDYLSNQNAIQSPLWMYDKTLVIILYKNIKKITRAKETIKMFHW